MEFQAALERIVSTVARSMSRLWQLLEKLTTSSSWCRGISRGMVVHCFVLFYFLWRQRAQISREGFRRNGYQQPWKCLSVVFILNEDQELLMIMNATLLNLPHLNVENVISLATGHLTLHQFKDSKQGKKRTTKLSISPRPTKLMCN
jgi:hypothetical protein